MAYRARLRDAMRALAPGIFVALPVMVRLPEALARASWATLGRDHGIFQYIAWAASRHGQVMYRDVRDVNGPLVPMVHEIMLALGGANEHRFRVIDLVVTGLTAAFCGGAIAYCGAIGEAPASTSASSRVRRMPWLRIASMALAAWAIVIAQYVAYGSWNTAQRESFFDWFVVTSMGLELLALGRASHPRALLFGAGATSAIAWLGKPTFILFTLGQLFTLFTGDMAVSKRTRFAWFFSGAAIGVATAVAYLFGRGDVVAWARITFVDIPAMYRFIWPQSPNTILFLYYGPTSMSAIAASVAIAVLVMTQRMPRRMLLLATMPLAGLASVVIQAKGFPYHFHPVSLGTALALLAIVHCAWVHADALKLNALGIGARAGATALAIALGVRAYSALERLPYPPVPIARDPASLESEERLLPFERVDFFPFALRQAAAFVAARTTPEEAVQTYGMDPYVLFLANRKSATPYIYAYDLNVDAALAGSPEPQGLHPTPEQARTIQAMRDDHERDLLRRLERTPPPAFVFVGRSPLMSFPDAVTDFHVHCPTAAAWVFEHYVEAANFDTIRVWLRRDRL